MRIDRENIVFIHANQQLKCTCMHCGACRGVALRVSPQPKEVLELVVNAMRTQ